MSTFRGRAALLILMLGVMFALSDAATPAHAQAGTPLPPTPTPVPFCPPDLQKTCEWAAAVTSSYGMWVFIVIVLILLSVWLFRRFGTVATKKAEQYIEETVAEAETASELSDATRRYLEKAIEDYRHFKFRGLETRARGVEPPELDQAFVTVRMTPEAGRELIEGQSEKERADLLVTTSVNTEAGTISRLERLSRPVDLTGAIEQSSKLAIVGAAGSGKSTLLQWAGLACARARVKRRKLTDEQRALVTALGDTPLTPVFVPLRAFNRYCEEKKLDRTAQALLGFVAAHIAEKHPALDLPADFFETQLRGAGCLLMFDGVDEVDPDDRERVREAIEAVVREFRDNDRNRYLVTSRTVAYFGAAEVTGFRKCVVQNLTPDQRDTLIHSWCGAVYPGDEAKQQADDLCHRLALSDERVRNLAVTRLMVTIFALVHYDHRELPRQRAELYEHAVRILLTEPYKEGEAAAGLKEWGGLDWETRRNRMAFVAFELHAQKAEDLPEDDLVDLIWRAFGAPGEERAAREQARKFVRLVAERGGLLEEENRRYGFFTHRTFREFLAGRYLAEEKSADEQKAFLLPRLGDDHWEESVRLAAGYLAIAGERRANDFIRLLADLGSTPDAHAHALTLAGLSLSDLPTDRARADTRAMVTQSLLDTFTANPPIVEPPLRRRLGLALGAVGDPRFAPSPLHPPSPDAVRRERGGEVALITLPAGSFRMGTSPAEAEKLKAQNAEAWDDEKPQHTVFVSEFAIGKYPVTNAEFRLFVEAKGYEQEEYWGADGWRWRTGQLEADLSIYSEETRKSVADWLARRPVEKRSQPFYGDDPQWNAPNLPVVGVTWYEAEAYCNWLRAVTGQNFRLPTEAQWEKAARFSPLSLAGRGVGGEGRLWPWGDEWDPNKCNSHESNFNATTPVGMYPDGTYPDGPLDMVSNVWEWCADWWASDLYKERVGQEVHDPAGPASGVARVLRGGAWYYNRWICRAAYRLWYVPADYNDSIGFRLVGSPARS